MVRSNAVIICNVQTKVSMDYTQLYPSGQWFIYTWVLCQSREEFPDNDKTITYLYIFEILGLLGAEQLIVWSLQRFYDLKTLFIIQIGLSNDKTITYKGSCTDESSSMLSGLSVDSSSIPVNPKHQNCIDPDINEKIKI